ncbi:hypothetical protein F7D09_1838 [Bifidobacterium leontopitheci]|uniref:Uncharacterized protein n=1 Tax=Bifidobacterium leontopitheci TaxID=2650774 RepID=A0A6I1GDQ9_9BIFI|nr:hypothetical protein F7D09_1838 [Bifidobacterium leontopitheci]
MPAASPAVNAIMLRNGTVPGNGLGRPNSGTTCMSAVAGKAMRARKLDAQTYPANLSRKLLRNRRQRRITLGAAACGLRAAINAQ